MALAGLLAFSSSAGAKPRPGDPDRSFGGDGLVRTLVSPGHSFAYGLAIGNHGRIVVSGHNRSGFALARYKPDGRLDRSFSGNGKLSTGFGDDHANALAVAIGHKGSIVAAGETCLSNGECRFAVAKYTPDGHLDPSFGDRGRMTLDFGVERSAHVSSVALEPGGRVLLAGDTCIGKNCDFALARLDSSGALDRSFGNGGRVVTTFTTKSGDYVSSSATSMAVDRHGRIVVGGVGQEGFAALARYDPNGHRDHSFGHGREVKDLSRMGGIRALALDAKDNVVAAGFDKKDPKDRWALARFGHRGRIDTSFGDHGQVSTGFSGKGRVFPRALAIDSRIGSSSRARRSSVWLATGRTASSADGSAATGECWRASARGIRTMPTDWRSTHATGRWSRASPSVSSRLRASWASAQGHRGGRGPSDQALPEGSVPQSRAASAFA